MQFNANRQHDRIRFYEVGATYHKNGQEFSEQQKLAGVVMGPAVPTQWGVNKEQKVDFYDVKADLEAVLALTGHKIKTPLYLMSSSTLLCIQVRVRH